MQKTLVEVEKHLNSLPYYESVWEENAEDSSIHTNFELRSRIRKTEYISGILDHKMELVKIERLLRFFDLNKRPKNIEYSESFIDYVKDQIKYLTSKRVILIETIEKLNNSIYIEIGDIYGE